MFKLYFIAFILCYVLNTTQLINGAIKNVVCKGSDNTKWCSADTSTITITGEDFKVDTSATKFLLNEKLNIYIAKEQTAFDATKLQGKLEYDVKTVPEGPQLIRIPAASGNDKYYECTVVLGNLNGLEDIEPFLPKPLPTDVYVNNQMYDNITSACNFTLHGVFDDSHQYVVMFYSEGDPWNYPECEKPIQTKDTVSCTISYAPNDLKGFRFLLEDITSSMYVNVRNVQNPLDIVKDSPSCHQVTTTRTPTSSPIVVNATGDCALKSSQCVSDAILEFTGINFNEESSSNRINIEKLNESSCKVTDANETFIACSLYNINPKVKGTYTLTLQEKKSDKTWSEVKTRMGTLILGASDSPGWTLFYVLPSETPSPSELPVSPSSHTKKVTTALTIVFALLFAIALASLIFMSCKYKMIPRKVWYSITSQLSVTNGNNISSNRNVANNNNNDNSEPVHN